MLELGIKAPDFELPDQNGEMHKLSWRQIKLKCRTWRPSGRCKSYKVLRTEK